MQKEENSQKKPQKKDGFSFRIIHLILIVGSLVICCLMFYATNQMSEKIYYLAEASEQQIEMVDAARELMDASDYLTEKVQRFTVNGDMQFLEDYFTEAFEDNHREEAIARMSDGAGRSSALEKLETAMEASLNLMSREYYAMRLVIEAKGYTDYPDILKSVELSAEDMALSPKEKMDRATEMVLDDDYYTQKDQIRINMRKSLDELEQMAQNTDTNAILNLRRELEFVRSVAVVQTIGIFLMVWLTSVLGIQPIINAEDRIKADRPLPEIGAREYRYLARAYNKMYSIHKKNLERLNFKASHDELTGAYNRSGYELLLSNIDLATTCMMLIDVDNFKTINDSYGHEMGDKALIKLVAILKKVFRSNDHICRIGGDEFVVLMENSNEMQKELIASKIDRINKELGDTGDGLPPVSISVGIVHGSEASSTEHLFEMTDAAMYQSKQNGKSTYTFS